jgi:hypothetical protein
MQHKKIIMVQDKRSPWLHDNKADFAGMGRTTVFSCASRSVCHRYDRRNPGAELGLKVNKLQSGPLQTSNWRQDCQYEIDF